MADRDQGGVKSANRALDIIELVIARGQPLVAQEIATGLGIPISSLSYLLSTLVARGYLARDGRRYLPGAGLERLRLRERGFSLADRAAPLVRTLRTQLNETSSFFVRDGWQLEALVTETSEQALRYAVPPGAHNGLHGFAAGKAILAALPDAELDRYFKESERLPFTERTVTDEAVLRAELAIARRDGVAVTIGEYDLGIIGIGRAAIVGGEVAGAFSVAYPQTRDTPALRARIVDLLGRVAALLEGS
ncbi:transcriptional regulator, IclR family [Sphingomonas guangdongensis]|uniref:Transcriptional regulator, IclR family n=1 Tax=Sphingomonas guangdongensis TaxID=1141890 RepID=A0A285R788_9SPHN|nr:IclR family transcriptional regulator C-terminal domain-containing protein [Sphingomonas guangdongensis]SOB88227.1 transcriptional regulator, IclR family [Sphingomonas guangdongensis]